MDVTFLESEHFFTSLSSSSSRQGEIMSAEQNWEHWTGFKESVMKNSGGDNEIISKILDNMEANIQPPTSTPILGDNTEYVDIETETEILRDQGEMESAENGEQVETEIEILRDQKEMESVETGEQMEEIGEAFNERPFHAVTVPQLIQSPKNIREVQVLNSSQNIFAGYNLPFRCNHGQPPK